ncbi:MAG: hypothetical protein A2Y25_08615 [Candidatus Melainabacteria bacterium GWF2_37_15]|nr:MAG: hypothetical protein A2Y25_08615 [Candidatus Melainabacteria bacterium GWF2_37_15]
MRDNQEQRELIEKLIKKSPGFKGNEDLFEEMVNETLKKSQSFLESSIEVPNPEVYIKKIAINAIVEIVKNAEKIRANKEKTIQVDEEFEEVTLDYETDNEGKIVNNFKIPEIKDIQSFGMDDEKINAIKQKVIELDKKNSSQNYKQIFELRFVREMKTPEIAKKLETKENEVSKSLMELYKEIDSV